MTDILLKVLIICMLAKVSYEFGYMRALEDTEEEFEELLEEIRNDGQRNQE